MADIAQGYIHLKPFDLSREPEIVGDAILEDAKRVAITIYDFPLRLDVRLEEGSLRAWIGVAALLYPAIASYPDFKQGAQELYNDAKNFGELAIERVTKELRPSKYQIFRRERRTLVSGKLLKLAERIEKLEKYRSAAGGAPVDGEIDAIEAELMEIVRHLDEEDAAALLGVVKLPKRSGGEIHQISRVLVRPRQLDMLTEKAPIDVRDQGRSLLYDKSEYLNLHGTTKLVGLE